jgi:hypothetical protein
MRKLTAVKTVGLAAVLALVAGVAIHAQTAPAGERKTLTGLVSDTMCAKKHMAKDKPDADCVRMCVKNGNGFALIAGDQIYALKGHSAELDKYAAQKVTVTGTLSGNSLAVDSVALAK